MTVKFLDTNALAKLYIAEKGSAWLKMHVSSGQIVISELALFESVTVLRRRFIEGTFSQDEAARLYNVINADSAKFEIIPLGGSNQLDRLETLAFSLPTNLRIRALDGIHLAAALLAQEAANSLDPPEPFVFVSSDVQLVKVAQAVGLTVENPEDHP